MLEQDNLRNLIWDHTYVPKVILNLIMEYKNDIILFIDISNLKISNKPIIKILKIGFGVEQLIIELIDLTGD